MTTFKDWQPRGVIPAVLLPFKSDFSIDAAAYREHLRDVGGVAGITALTVNGHSCEVHALNLDEQREVMRLTMDEVGDRLPIIAGIYATAASKPPASPATRKPTAPRRCSFSRRKA